jgi:XTP/dITP diphosphohydrolase
MELILASANAHKVQEIAAKLQELGLDSIKLGSIADYPDFTMPEETGGTFNANALIKARAVAELSGKAALADDSGLTVDALNGEPGVDSAYYAGSDKNDAANNAKLLQALSSIAAEQRRAQFRCVIAVVLPDGREYLAEGKVEGVIVDQPRGAQGFGYDPLFYLPSLGCTMAELSCEQKNQLSHRALALESLAAQLRFLPENL